MSGLESQTVSSSTARALRSGIAARRGISSARGKSTAATRTRRSRAKSVWRRCAMGTNHIMCFGVWRQGTRRLAERGNRDGATRWHMPYRMQASTIVNRAEASAQCEGQ